jgi:hypothetical protein
VAGINTAMTKNTDIKTATRDWMLGYRSWMTHAVTLTMKQYRIIETDKGQTVQGLTADEARKNFRHFMSRLNRSMYGNGPKRHYVIPVLEGMATGKNLHYHCVMGCTAMTGSTTSRRKSAWVSPTALTTGMCTFLIADNHKARPHQVVRAALLT